MSGNNECGKEKKSLDVCDRGADHCSQHQYVQAGSLWRGSFSDIYEKLIPISFGMLYILVNSALLIFAFICDRHYIGIATFINLFLLGYVVQYCLSMLRVLFAEPSMLVRSISFISGFILLCLGSSFYMTADLGVSTYDAVALIISDTWKKGEFKYIRICTDIICVVAGNVLFLSGGGSVRQTMQLVGIGTIVTAFLMGPLIDFFNRKIIRLL